MANPFATIVIPQKKKWHLTENLVRQLAEHEPNVAVIVLEDGPDAEWEAPQHPDLKYLASGTTGLTAAWNRGVQLANSRWVILLNNDVECSGPFVNRLVQAQGAQSGISGPKIRRESGVEVLEGWCMAFSHFTWRMLGGFDERMQLYFSDADYMVRAKAGGFPLYEVPDLPLRHIGHQTAHDPEITPDRNRTWMSDRNYYFSKHQQGSCVNC